MTIDQLEKKESKEKEPFTAEEFRALLNEVQQKVKDTEKDFLVKVKAQKMGYVDAKIKTLAEQKEINAKFVEKLLAEKERFGHVFKTQPGSIYFMLMGGESFRAKYDPGDNSYSLQPLMEKVFFVSGEESNRILSFKKWENVLGVPITISHFALGTSPLEVNIAERNSNLICDQKNNTLTLIPQQREYGRPILNLSLHIGHEITEIIK